jgi:hypothetical protein
MTHAASWSFYLTAALLVCSNLPDSKVDYTLYKSSKIVITFMWLVVIILSTTKKDLGLQVFHNLYFCFEPLAYG